VSTQAGISTTYKRNLALEVLNFNSDGTIKQVTYTMDGVPQVGTLNPYVRVEAETMNAQSGIETETCSEGGMDVTQISNGDWTRVRGVDFGTAGAKTFNVRVASTANGGGIELHLGSLTGTLIGTCNIPATGGTQTWMTTACNITGAIGVNDLYFKFTGSQTFNFNYWQFTGGDGGAGGNGGAAGAGGTSGTGGAAGTGGGSGTGGLAGTRGSGGTGGASGLAGSSGAAGTPGIGGVCPGQERAGGRAPAAAEVRVGRAASVALPVKGQGEEPPLAPAVRSGPAASPEPAGDPRRGLAAPASDRTAARRKSLVRLGDARARSAGEATADCWQSAWPWPCCRAGGGREGARGRRHRRLAVSSMICQEREIASGQVTPWRTRAGALACLLGSDFGAIVFLDTRANGGNRGEGAGGVRR
jgi:hypothetical protein